MYLYFFLFLLQDIQYLMDTARYGVIYFSMGSNFKSFEMSDQMKQSISHIFSTFKQRIFWKFEGEINNIPPNVFLMEWAPQQSILGKTLIKNIIKPVRYNRREAETRG